MKIKIGNFNFINNMPNELTDYDLRNNSHIFDYFYLDGKEDTLFVDNYYKFENATEERFKEIEEFKFEHALLKKYRVVPYFKEINKQINNYIVQKASQDFLNAEYSRYDLYNKIEEYNIANLDNNKEYNFGYKTDIVKDMENNKIKVGNFIFNPYTEKVINLDEQYELGKFNGAIKTNLILFEIANKQAPEFVNTILKINDFMKDKKTINVCLTNGEKVKIDAGIVHLLDLKDNKFNLSFNLEYAYEKEFGNDNKLKLEDIKGISYGKDFLEIDPKTLINIKEQIAISTADKLKFKLDEIKENIDCEYRDYLYSCQKDINKSNIPYGLENALRVITNIEFKNNIIEEKMKNGTYNEKEDGMFIGFPEWYTDDLESIFEKNDLYNSLIQAESPEEAIKVAKELDDKELLNILEDSKEEFYKEESEEDEL